MKILVDENIPFAEESFGQHGELQRFHGRQLTAKDLDSVDALITRSITQVNSQLLSLHKPAFIGTCTIGTDHLDSAFLESQGIAWAYAPGCNAQSVVDYVLSCIAALKGTKFPETVGIIGCGNVGGLLRKAMKALGIEVRVYDPFLDKQQIPELQVLEQVFQSQLVCVHTPFTQDGPYPTKNMIGMELLEYLPSDAMLLSAGRGGVIKEDDLLAFMGKRPDIKVVLDVWANEPRINSELMQKVAISTPHIAGYSLEGKRRGTEQVYQAFCSHFGLQSVEMASLQSAGLLTGENYAERLLGAYDPQADSDAMQSRYAQTTVSEQDSGSWFDELRRQYPVRREFASYFSEPSAN